MKLSEHWAKTRPEIGSGERPVLRVLARIEVLPVKLGIDHPLPGLFRLWQAAHGPTLLHRLPVVSHE